MSNLRLLDPAFPPFGDGLENTLRRFFQAPAAFESALPQVPQMRIDVSEEEGGYTVKADLPGVRKEDISVSVEGNLVRIDAQVRSEQEKKDNGGRVLRSERYSGAVSRSFTLAHDIDAAKVQARYADGVLALQLPKAAASEANRITVQ